MEDEPASPTGGLGYENEGMRRRDLLTRGTAVAATGVVFTAGTIHGLSTRPDFAAAQSGGPIDPGDPGAVFDFDRAVIGFDVLDVDQSVDEDVDVSFGLFGDGTLHYHHHFNPVGPDYHFLIDAGAFLGGQIPDTCTISGHDFDGDPPDASNFVGAPGDGGATDARWSDPPGGPSEATSHLHVTCT